MHSLILFVDLSKDWTQSHTNKCFLVWYSSTYPVCSPSALQAPFIQKSFHHWNEVISRAESSSQIDNLHRTYGTTVGWNNWRARNQEKLLENQVMQGFLRYWTKNIIHGKPMATLNFIKMKNDPFKHMLVRGWKSQHTGSQCLLSYV